MNIIIHCASLVTSRVTLPRICCISSTPFLYIHSLFLSWKLAPTRAFTNFTSLPLHDSVSQLPSSCECHPRHHLSSHTQEFHPGFRDPHQPGFHPSEKSYQYPVHSRSNEMKREYFSIIYRDYMLPDPKQVPHYVSRLVSSLDPHVIASIPIALSKLASRSKLHQQAVLDYIIHVKHFPIHTTAVANAENVTHDPGARDPHTYQATHVQLPWISQGHTCNDPTSHPKNYSQVRHDFFGDPWSYAACEAFSRLDLREHASILRSFAVLKNTPPKSYLNHFYAAYLAKINTISSYLLISPLMSFAVLQILPDRSYLDQCLEQIHMRAHSLSNIELAMVIHATSRLNLNLPSYFCETLQNAIQKRIKDSNQNSYHNTDDHWKQNPFIEKNFRFQIVNGSLYSSSETKWVSNLLSDTSESHPSRLQETHDIHPKSTQKINAILHAEDSSASTVEKLMQSLALKRVRPSQWFENVQATVQQLPPTALVTILSSLTLHKIKPSDTFLLNWQIALLPHLKFLQPKDFHDIVSAFYKLQLKPMRPFLQKLLTEAEKSVVPDLEFPITAQNVHLEFSRTDKPPLNPSSLSHFDPHALVHLLYGLSSFGMRLNAFTFMQKWEAIMTTHLSSLSTLDLAIAALALAKLRHTSTASFQSRWENCVLEKIHTFPNSHISILLRAYSLRKTQAPMRILDVSLDLLNAKFNEINNFTFATIANSLLHILTIEQRCQPSFHPKLVHFLIQFPSSRMHAFTEAQLAGLILTVGKLNIHPPDEFMTMWYEASLQKLDKHAPSDLCRSIHGLSHVSKDISPRYLELWLSKTIRSLNTFNETEFIDSMVSLSRFNQEIPKECLEKFRDYIAFGNIPFGAKTRHRLREPASRFGWSEVFE